jgi:hypothetical protein
MKEQKDVQVGETYFLDWPCVALGECGVGLQHPHASRDLAWKEARTSRTTVRFNEG